MKTEKRFRSVTYEVVISEADGNGVRVLSSGVDYETASADVRLYLLDGIDARVRITEKPIDYWL
jgi:hypothetical protein